MCFQLGGKNPVFIDPGCDIELAARRLLWGKCGNSGQVCIAPDYVLVPRHFQDKLVAVLTVECVSRGFPPLVFWLIYRLYIGTRSVSLTAPPSQTRSAASRARSSTRA